jgi:hypothetical protein
MGLRRVSFSRYLFSASRPTFRVLLVVGIRGFQSVHTNFPYSRAARVVVHLPELRRGAFSKENLEVRLSLAAMS